MTHMTSECCTKSNASNQKKYGCVCMMKVIITEFPTNSLSHLKSGDDSIGRNKNINNKSMTQNEFQ